MLVSNSYIHYLQVLVSSPPLQQFFSQPNYKVEQAPLTGGLQEVFLQAQSSRLWQQRFKPTSSTPTYAMMSVFARASAYHSTSVWVHSRSSAL